MTSQYNHICFYDFEATTDTSPHKAYLVSFALDNQPVKSFYGVNCAKLFLKSMSDNTLAIAHNGGGYDISFIIDLLAYINDNPIIKNGRVLQLRGTHRVKAFKNHKWFHEYRVITFKDSYAIITKPLKAFPEMFNLDSGRKEVFPYNYYNSINVQSIYGNIDEALNYIPINEQDQFLNNLQELDCVHNTSQFNMKTYAIFYCEQDVRILHQGFQTFRQLLLNEFNLDVYSFVSISSIANRYMEFNCYWKKSVIITVMISIRNYQSIYWIGSLRCFTCRKAIQEKVWFDLSSKGTG